MKKILNKTIFGIFGVFTLFLSLCAPSSAAYCNSPCPNPCSPSRTICEGVNCTTYCSSSSIYNTAHYTTPGVSFSYSTPNVSFSVSNEVYGLHNLAPKRVIVSNAFRPVYHKAPPKPANPVINHKNPPNPAVKPALKPGNKPALQKRV